MHQTCKSIQSAVVIWRFRIWTRFVRAVLFSKKNLRPPSGCFSALAQITNELPLQGRIVLRDQGKPTIPTYSIQEKSGLRQHLEQPWPIFWSRHSNARLLGPGLALVNENGKIATESVYGESRAKTDPSYQYIPLRPPWRLSGSWTSILSRWVPTDQPTNFCHWLLEALPRLAILDELPKEVGILVPPRLLPFQTESLEWLGLKHRTRATPEKHLLVDDYFFSSPPAMIVCYNPYAVHFLRSRLLPFASEKPSGKKRIFIRRTGQFRNIVNDREVIAFFQRLGWSIVDTAILSLAEQIRMFADAEAICGAHGAAFTNVVWCQPNCRVIELFADSFLSGCFEWVANCVQAHHSFIIFPSDHAMNARIDLSRLKKHLEDVGAV